MSLIEKRKIVAAKIETTAGTAESLANADTAFYGYDANYNPTSNFTNRNAAGTTGMYPSVLGIETGQITFTTDWYATPPWAPILLPAAGFVGADNVYTPADNTSNWKTVTIGFNRAGKLYQLAGAMGDYVVNLVAGQPVTVDWTFTGRKVAPSDAAQFTPAFTVANDVTPPRYAGATTTLGGSAICWNTGTLAIGNTVAVLPCQNSEGGIERAWINERNITLTIDPLEELAGTRDDDALLKAGTTQALSTAWGDTSISIPRAQRIAAPFGERNGLSTRQIQLLATIIESETVANSLSLDFNTAD